MNGTGLTPHPERLTLFARACERLGAAMAHLAEREVAQADRAFAELGAAIRRATPILPVTGRSKPAA